MPGRNTPDEHSAGQSGRPSERDHSGINASSVTRWAAEANAFLTRYTDETYGLEDPAAVARTMCRMLAERIGATQVFWAALDADAQEFYILEAFCPPSTVWKGNRYPVDEWEPLATQYRAGVSCAVPDARTDPRLTSAAKAHHAGAGVLASVAAPVLIRGELRSLLVAGHDEARRWTPEEIALIETSAGRCWAAVERARAQTALRENEARFRALAETAPVGIGVGTMEGEVYYINPGYERMFGYEPGEMIKRSEEDCHFDPADRQAWHAELTKQGGRLLDYEIRVKRKDGGPIWLSVNSAPIDYNGKPAYVDVALDITQRRQAEDALRAADRAKDDFLAMLSHELRNPLNAAANALQLLRLHTTESAATTRAVDILTRQHAQMTRLIDDLLEVNRITHGKREIRKAPVALDLVVLNAVRTLQPRIHAQGLQFRYDGDPAVKTLGDAPRLEQVVMNLVGNAIKFTSEGSIHITVRRRGDEAELRVRDTGEGIPDDVLPRIFELFSQGNVGLARSKGGLGIGLTIVKSLVEQHGGRVAAAAAPSGKGSVFTVTLPLWHGDAAPEQAEKQASDRASDSRDALKVLVVDDNPDAAETLVDILEAWGHTAQAVYDGAAAVETATAERPDVVLLDIGLPGKDGYGVAQALRAQPATAEIRLIAVTGYGQESDRRQTADAGFEAHLVKPLDLETLRRCLGPA